jgi:hypothetical protein
MKEYIGTRFSDGSTIIRVISGGGIYPLDMQLDIADHSPTGFEWGYSGSGPTQLALALAADHLGSDDPPFHVIYMLKQEIVRGLPYDGWAFTSGDINDVIVEGTHRYHEILEGI